MRLSRAFAVGAALVAVVAVAGCGSDDSGGSSASSEGSLDSEIPTASDIASVASYVETYGPCQDLRTGEEYDNSHGGPRDSESSNTSWGSEEAKDTSWGIKERAVCSNASGKPVTLLLVPSMDKFIKKYRSTMEEVRKNSDYMFDRFMVGQNFAVVTEDFGEGKFLHQSTLMLLKCDPEFVLPKTYKNMTEIDGCVLTDYFGN
ncbi:hypothetical protein [Streptomyces europaeiscabiei]|uniref:hypothetical protein n=1 Tax=Streptomyces europaeiscabiei TaxID=146819 RepID=UPI0038F7D470